VGRPSTLISEVDNMSIAVAVESEKLESGCCSCCLCETESSGDDLGVQDKLSLIYMAMLGSLTIVASIAQFVVGGFIFNYLEGNRRGCWWAAVLTIFAGFSSVMIRKKGWITATCVISTFAILGAGVGAVLDAVSWRLLKDLQACATFEESNDTYSWYGSRNQSASALSCINNLKIENENLKNSCVCVNSVDTCHNFKLATSVMGANDCRGILTTIPRLLLTSTALCATIGFLALTLAIGSCVIKCCPKKDYDDEVQTAQFVVRDQPVTALAVVDHDATNTRGVESTF
jgi:predicted membrane protein